MLPQNDEAAGDDCGGVDAYKHTGGTRHQWTPLSASSLLQRMPALILPGYEMSKGQQLRSGDSLRHMRVGFLERQSAFDEQKNEVHLKRKKYTNHKTGQFG